MKKSFRIVLCLVLVLGSLLCLSACGSQSNSTPVGDSSVKQYTTGRYEIQTITWDDGTSASGDTLSLMGATYVELYSDNTAQLCLFGVLADMEYSDSKMWRAGSEFLSYEFSVKDGKVTLTDNGTTYVFIKK